MSLRSFTLYDSFQRNAPLYPDPVALKSPAMDREAVKRLYGQGGNRS